MFDISESGVGLICFQVEVLEKDSSLMMQILLIVIQNVEVLEILKVLKVLEVLEDVKVLKVFGVLKVIEVLKILEVWEVFVIQVLFIIQLIDIQVLVVENKSLVVDIKKQNVDLQVVIMFVIEIKKVSYVVDMKVNIKVQEIEVVFFQVLVDEFEFESVVVQFQENQDIWFKVKVKKV